MIYNSDADQHDDDPYKNDELIVNVKKNGMSLKFDWKSFGTELNNKLEDIPFAAEKLDYLIAVNDAVGYIKPIIEVTIPIMMSLYDDFVSIEDKVRCAGFVCSYSANKNFRQQGLNILEENYDSCFDTGFRITALTNLLNDDRPRHRTQTEHYNKQVDYYNEWTTLIEEEDEPKDKAFSAYLLLEPMKLCNIFKAPLLSMIINNLDFCEDLDNKIDIITFCNREFENKSGKKGYINSKANKTFFPTASNFDWESRFLDAGFQLMHKTGYNAAIKFMCSRVAECDHQDWVHRAYGIFDFLCDTFAEKEYSPLADLLSVEKGFISKSVQQPFDLIKQSDTYLNWAKNLKKKAHKDGLISELNAFENLRSSYQHVKDISKQEAENNSLVLQASLTTFKYNFWGWYRLAEFSP